VVPFKQLKCIVFDYCDLIGVFKIICSKKLIFSITIIKQKIIYHYEKKYEKCKRDWFDYLFHKRRVPWPMVTNNIANEQRSSRAE
jgi:hypothetical protein